MDKDYNEFKNSQGTTPPKELDQKILGAVHRELAPSHQRVFFKLVLVQAFIGTLTLLFCPQFDFSLTSNHEIFHYFHHTFGPVACMAVCGSLFIGSGAIFASYILTLSEINQIRKSRFLYYAAISGISLLLFILLGADIYLNIAIAWFIGATVTGMALMELNRLFRYGIIRSLGVLL